MSLSPAYLTFDGDVANGVNPYRPGTNDVGGCQKLDDSEEPPDDETMASADDFNQMGKLIVALCKVAGAAVMYVSNSGTPAITGLRAAGSLLTVPDFTVIDQATGDTEIKCPASKLMAPLGCIAVPQKAGDYRASARINTTGDGVRVEMRNSAGTLTDADFLLVWV